MKRVTLKILSISIILAALVATDSVASNRSGFDLDVLVDGSARREYYSQGTVYVEAIRGKEYSLRITNPTSRRVAVALSVDGLNTIDAKHTDARAAAKWVIAPYDTIEISGWQVSDRAARSFFFTGERNSYGEALGQTENLGVIEAVFFLEREPEVSWWQPWKRGRAESRGAAADAPSAPSSESAGRDSSSSKAQAEAEPSDDFAATGMGDRRKHAVTAVEMKLEDRPAASLRIRYEFRKQLVELGVLHDPLTPLDRRERARGFDSFCPEPGKRH